MAVTTTAGEFERAEAIALSKARRSVIEDRVFFILTVASAVFVVVMLVGVIGAAATSFLLFAIDKSALPATILQLLLVALSFHGMIVGGMGQFFAELFPTKVRFTAMSVSYQLASVFGGSVAPIIGTLLIDRTGQATSVPIYAAIVAVPALICIMLSRETRGVDLSAEK